MTKRILVKVVIMVLFIIVAWINFKSYQNLPVSTKQVPGTILFSIKRLSEKLQTELIFINNQKADFENILIKRRLSELSILVNNKELSQIETSGSRFMTQIQSSKNPVITEDMLIQLSDLRDTFQANSSYWLIIQQCIDVGRHYFK